MIARRITKSPEFCVFQGKSTLPSRKRKSTGVKRSKKRIKNRNFPEFEETTLPTWNEANGRVLCSLISDYQSRKHLPVNRSFISNNSRQAFS